MAERNLLVNTFKCLIGRDATGKITCGIYTDIYHDCDSYITLFYESNGRVKHYKKPLTYFLDDKGALGRTNKREEDKEIEEAIEAVAKGTGFGISELRHHLQCLA